MPDAGQPPALADLDAEMLACAVAVRVCFAELVRQAEFEQIPPAQVLKTAVVRYVRRSDRRRRRLAFEAAKKVIP